MRNVENVCQLIFNKESEQHSAIFYLGVSIVDTKAKPISPLSSINQKCLETFLISDMTFLNQQCKSLYLDSIGLRRETIFTPCCFNSLGSLIYRRPPLKLQANVGITLFVNINETAILEF